MTSVEPPYIATGGDTLIAAARRQIEAGLGGAPYPTLSAVRGRVADPSVLPDGS